MSKLFLLFASASMVVALAVVSRAQQTRASVGGESSLRGRVASLAPTAHAALPHEASQFWLAPDPGAPPLRQPSVSALSAAVKLEADGAYSKALELVSQPAARLGPLALYATYYAGVAQLRLARAAQARSTFQGVQAQKPVGYLTEAAALGEAEASEALSDPAAAVAIYERLLGGKPATLEDVLMRLGRAARAAGEAEKAAAAFSRVYYEFPLSEVAPTASAELALLPNAQTLAASPDRYKLELDRAERLYAAKQYPAARTAFEALRATASGDERDLVELRLAECDHFLKHPRSARDGTRRFADSGPRQAEALYFHALSLRERGDRDEYIQTVRRIVAEFATEPWAEEALNNLASYYVANSEDEQADAVFRELCEKRPRSRYSERAAWKAGWRAYRAGVYGEAARFFERGAADFPRSDYRPAWLYWAARAHDQLNEASLAHERYTLAVTDYLNTYYGRLALTRLGGRLPAARVATSPSAGNRQDVPLPPSLPPNAPVVRALLGAELYDDALNELRYAQKTWGDSPPVQATIAWTHRQQARSESGTRRFQLLRSAVTGMRRAYPQFMAAGGEDLPSDVLTVIFPIAYWDLIRRHASEHELDPYFVAALVAQESTFVADIKSKANAVGLMQLMPSTARAYARKLSLPYSSRLSTDPEANIRMGTAYLADKLKEFGNPHLALASYNAGERAVRRWLADRPGLDRDEFIDDIPYPETQNYVKRILGTAEDYRRLYSNDRPLTDSVDTNATPAAPAKVTSSPQDRKAPAGKTSQTQSASPKRSPKVRKSA
jgi:soluble lytic murein transglycosylase